MMPWDQYFMLIGGVIFGSAIVITIWTLWTNRKR